MSDTVITDAGIDLLRRAIRDDGTLPIAYFKVGEGGWEDDGGQVQRDPDPELTDLDCVENSGNYPSDSLFTFTKSIAPSRITYPAEGQVSIECLVDINEANDDGFGDPPEFWELGIFSTDGTMISHTTFTMAPKSDLVVFRAIVTLQFQRPA